MYNLYNMWIFCTFRPDGGALMKGEDFQLWKATTSLPVHFDGNWNNVSWPAEVELFYYLLSSWMPPEHYGGPTCATGLWWDCDSIFTQIPPPLQSIYSVTQIRPQWSAWHSQILTHPNTSRHFMLIVGFDVVKYLKFKGYMLHLLFLVHLNAL